MDKKTVHIPNISCDHCALTIENELKGLKGVSGIKVNVPKKELTVNWDKPASWKLISDILAEINYPPQE